MATRAERREVQNAQRQSKLASTMNPSFATNVILARHGQTDWNAEMRLQGHRDPPLNSLGRKQAEELAGALQAEPFHALYSSDLTRALQTAQAISARRPGGMQVHATAQLRERSLGVLEGLTLAEAAVQQPDALQALRAADEAAPLPGGESPEQMRLRVVAEVERIAAAHPGQTVLIVAHGGVLHQSYLHTVGHAYSGAIKNASVHRLRVQGRKWALIQWDALTPAEGGFGGGANEG